MGFNNLQEIKNTGLIGIVGGAGKMGSWTTRFLKRAGCKKLGIYDPSDKTQALADELEVKKFEDPNELAEQSDMVIVSVPPKKTEEVIHSIGKRIRRDTILSELASSEKEKHANAMQRYSDHPIGIHPMFKDTVGIENLKGRNIALTPLHEKEPYVPFLTELFEETGASVRVLHPRKHDLIARFNQKAAHLVIITYGELIKTFCRKYDLDPSELASLDTPNSQVLNVLLGRFLGSYRTPEGFNFDVPWSIQNSEEDTISIREMLQTRTAALKDIIDSKDRDQFTSELEAMARKMKAPRISALSSASDMVERALREHTIQDYLSAQLETIKTDFDKHITAPLKKIGLFQESYVDSQNHVSSPQGVSPASNGRAYAEFLRPMNQLYFGVYGAMIINQDFEKARKIAVQLRREIDRVSTKGRKYDQVRQNKRRLEEAEEHIGGLIGSLTNLMNLKQLVS